MSSNKLYLNILHWVSDNTHLNILKYKLHAWFHYFLPNSKTMIETGNSSFHIYNQTIHYTFKIKYLDRF